MPDLMHRRLSLVVAIDRMWDRWHTPSQDIASVSRIVDCWVLCGRIAVNDGCRQSAIPQQSGRAQGSRGRGEIGLEVQVEVLVSALAETLFHLRGIGVGGPVVADGVGAAGFVHNEVDVCRGVGRVHDEQLFENLPLAVLE